MDNENLSRREFVARAARYGFLLSGGLFCYNIPAAKFFAKGKVDSFLNSVIEEALLQAAPAARYWTSTSSKNAGCLNCHTKDEIKSLTEHQHSVEVIRCLLCAQGCLIKKGERGKCRARMNINGTLRSLVYGHPAAVHIDPIEKKPLYHFLFGSQAYSLATAGCPLSCKFCQNWEISQAKPEDFSTKFIGPDEIVNLVVPTLNDLDKMLHGLTDWVACEVGFDVPFHFTRFHPDYKMLNLSPTPISTLEQAREIAMKKGIHFVYIGNVPGQWAYPS